MKGSLDLGVPSSSVTLVEVLSVERWEYRQEEIEK